MFMLNQNELSTCQCLGKKDRKLVAGKMAQQVRASIALPEGPEFGSQHQYLAAHKYQGL